MDYRKGKGRATDDHDDAQPTSPSSAENNTPSESMLSRIAGSAQGLTQSVLSNPRPQEFKEQTDNLQQGGGKATSNSYAPGRGEQVWAESSTATPTNLPAGKSMRSTDTERHVAQNESEFSAFLDGIPSFEPSDAVAADPSLMAQPYSAPTTAQHHGATAHGRFGSVAEQEANDGAEVVALLMDNQHPELWHFQPPEPENVEWNLSDEQVSTLRSITRELFPEAKRQQPLDAHDALNLSPFATSDPQGHPLDSALYFGEVIPEGPARELWFQQWEDVMTRYQDEVWGDLLPLVNSAREEVEAMRDGGSQDSAQSKAVLRLGQILGHIKARDRPRVDS